jgi:hypothetical protein
MFDIKKIPNTDKPNNIEMYLPISIEATDTTDLQPLFLSITGSLI